MSENERNFWDKFVVIVSVIGSLILLLQAAETYHHDKLSIQPLIGQTSEADTDKPALGLWVYNSGLGPAIIKQYRVCVDNQRVKGSEEAIARGGFKKDSIRYGELAEGDSIRAGDELTELFVLPIKNNTDAENTSFIKFINERVTLGIDYCSMDNDCQTYGSCK
jgi:hypothetical protein